MIMSKKITAERIAEIEKIPIIYDDDSPRITKEELKEFVLKNTTSEQGVNIEACCVGRLKGGRQ
ncbi:MAG: hypothetical protein ACTTJG_00690 [Treponema sp.]